MSNEATNPAVNLSGNAAVNLAAEQSKQTAHLNIPVFAGLPIPDDTANLRQGPNLHDGLLALLPLVGVWRGTGQMLVDGQDLQFGQQLTIAHNGENYLSFESRIYEIIEQEDGSQKHGPETREVGFWRISLEDEIELTAVSSTGVVEIFYGEPISERAWQVESASTLVTATGPATLGPGKRLYGLMPNNDLGWVEERIVAGELKPRMSAQLARVVG